jgi:hypothetical protein
MDADGPANQVSPSGDRGIARQFTRWPFPRETIDVFVGGQTVQSIRAVCSNLSASGLGLLTSIAIAPGSQVIVSLPHALGGTDTVRGEVVRCVAKREDRFDVGIKLRELIDPMNFVRIDPFVNIFVFEDVEASRISGTIALISSSQLDREMWQRSMRGTCALTNICEHVSEVEGIAAKLDLVALEAGRANEPAGEQLLRLVKHGFAGKVLLIAPDSSDRVRHEVYKMPSHAVLLRPFDGRTAQLAIAHAMGLQKRETREAA